MRLAKPATVSNSERLNPPYVGVAVDSVIRLFPTFFTKTTKIPTQRNYIHYSLQFNSIKNAHAATHTTCLPSQHASNSKTSSQSTISVSNENNNGHENSATKWSDVITGRASAITGQAELLAVGTTNGEIHLWERYGPNETHNHMCRCVSILSSRSE